MNQQFIDQLAVCERYHISPSTLRRRVLDGTFPPPVKIGRLIRWNLTDLQANENSFSKNEIETVEDQGQEIFSGIN